MAYDNLVNGSCFRFEKNVSDTVISQCGGHITCDVKGNCCFAFSSVGKKEGFCVMVFSVKQLPLTVCVWFCKPRTDLD
jgi:hypothetical protein